MSTCLLLRGYLCIGRSALERSFLNENNIKIREKILINIQLHLETLKDWFEHYFLTTQVLDDFIWVPILNSAEYEVLMGLISHSKLKISFQNQGLPEFWLNLHDEYKILSEKAGSRH